MLECLNCKKLVPDTEGKIFAACFVCPACYDLAERVYQRSQRQLQQLLTMLHEGIRLAIIKGQLQPVPHEGEVPKRELLEQIVALQARKDSADGQHRSLG